MIYWVLCKIGGERYRRGGRQRRIQPPVALKAIGKRLLSPCWWICCHLSLAWGDRFLCRMKPEPIAIHHWEDRQEAEGGREGEKASSGKMFLCPPSCHGWVMGKWVFYTQILRMGMLEYGISESGDRSGGPCTCRESCFQMRALLGRLFLGLLLPIVYHIALNYPVMGERLLERLVFLACLLKL